MKRQMSLTHYFSKIPKPESVVSDLDATKQSQAKPLQLEENSKMNENYIHSTCRVFEMVYGLAKYCMPFSEMEGMINLQNVLGKDTGAEWHSYETTLKMVDFIAKEIKMETFTSIIKHNLKICLVIDEVSELAFNPVLIILVKVEDICSPTIFLELVELEKQDAETIYSSVMESLNNVGFTKNYLEKNLIGFCSDGASALLGRKSGMSIRIAKEFPNIIIWHCLNHRLPLVLDDSIKEIKEVNHFKTFIDKMHILSTKFPLDLSEISEQLETDIFNIGWILGAKWAACSLRTALAVWDAYPALHHYFYSNEKKLAAHLENVYFITDLALMLDILKEMSLLSNALEGSNVDIIRAEKLVLRSIKAFQILGKAKGRYEKQVDELITSERFKNIKFVENNRFVGLPREKLLETITINLQKRLMDCEHLKASGSQFQDRNKLQFLNFLKPDSWNVEEVLVPWKAAEEQLLVFNDIFHYQIDMNDYRDFVRNVLRDSQNYAIPESVQAAKNIIGTIAVNSAEVGKIFSTMNEMCKRNMNRVYSENIYTLTVSNLSSAITINAVGLPREEWDPTPTVKKWLSINHTELLQQKRRKLKVRRTPV